MFIADNTTRHVGINVKHQTVQCLQTSSCDDGRATCATPARAFFPVAGDGLGEGGVRPAERPVTAAPEGDGPQGPGGGKIGVLKRNGSH